MKKDINSPETESIKTLIDNIDKYNIVLPEFQRDFVWEIGKTYDLFDSLVKDIFIGAIIYGIPSFEIAVRELDTRKRRGEGSKRKLKITLYSKDAVMKNINSFRLVLDGQQRITSIYRALKGHDHIWFIAKPDSDLPEEKEIPQLDLEEMLYEFSGQEDPKRLSIMLSDVFSIMSESYREKKIKELYFEKLAYLQNKNDNDKEIIFDKYLAIVSKIQDFFKAEKLLSYYLLNTISEKFALFFERSNSKSIPLNFIDILSAKLYAGFNLRAKVDKFAQTYTNKSNKKHILNKEIIVRTISFLVSEGKNIDKSYILSTLNYVHFNKYWDLVCDLYVKSLDFLYENHFIISQQWMPYQNMLLPLIIFLKEIGTDFSQMDEWQENFIKFWYWASIFAERYTSASNEIMIQDAKVLQLIAKKAKIADKSYFFKFKPKISSQDELLSITKKGSVLYSGILNLINYKAQGLRDWKNSSKLLFNTKIEDHHIFPKSYLQVKYKNDNSVIPLIDCVLNRTLIPKLTNASISKSPPSKYLKKIYDHNSKLHESLTQHLIPLNSIDGFYDEDYKGFLKDRGEKVFGFLSSFDLNNNTVKNNLRTYYHDINNDNVKNHNIIKIYAKYYSKIAEAKLKIETQEILYNNRWYDILEGTKVVKKDLTGKEVSSINAWEYWRYKDENNIERLIDELR